MHQHFVCLGSMWVWHQRVQPVRVNRLGDMTCPGPLIELLTFVFPDCLAVISVLMSEMSFVPSWDLTKEQRSTLLCFNIKIKESFGVRKHLKTDPAVEYHVLFLLPTWIHSNRIDLRRKTFFVNIIRYYSSINISIINEKKSKCIQLQHDQKRQLFTQFEHLQET